LAYLKFSDLLSIVTKGEFYIGFSSMAKFLTTSATSYHLEELVKNASEKVILISPFLKLNDRIKELLEDGLFTAKVNCSQPKSTGLMN